MKAVLLYLALFGGFCFLGYHVHTLQEELARREAELELWEELEIQAEPRGEFSPLSLRSSAEVLSATRSQGGTMSVLLRGDYYEIVQALAEWRETPLVSLTLRSVGGGVVEADVTLRPAR